MTFEPGINMLTHSVIIGILSFLGMTYGLGQGKVVAENRSLLVGAVALIYMVLFGHDFPPNTLNPGLFLDGVTNVSKKSS